MEVDRVQGMCSGWSVYRRIVKIKVKNCVNNVLLYH